MRIPLVALGLLLSLSTAAGALPPWTMEVVSDRLPLRVRFDAEADRALAEAALPALESAWDRLVGELGYPAPVSDGPAPDPNADAGAGGDVATGMVAYVTATAAGAGGGMAVWGLDLPDTPACDCSSRILVDVATPADDPGLPETLFHELVHATQYAADCTEPPSAYEAFAVAAVHDAFPDSEVVAGTLAQFQDFPNYPLDYWTMTFPCAGGEPCFPYQLGAALFDIFLKERFNGGPTTYREIWDGIGQDGATIVGPPYPRCDAGNTPDWFEAIDAWLRARGSDFDSAFREFAVWRVVVGARDDGAHFARGATYPEPSIVATVEARSPDSNPSVGGEIDVYELGTQYFAVVLPGAALPGGGDDETFVATVDGDPAAAWAASLVVWRPGAPVATAPLAFDGPAGRGPAGRGTIAVPADATRVVLAVSQLGDDAHDPDRMAWDDPRPFRWSLGPEIPDPTPDVVAGDTGGTADAVGSDTADATPVDEAPASSQPGSCATLGSAAGSAAGSAPDRAPGVLLVLSLLAGGLALRTGHRRRRRISR